MHSIGLTDDEKKGGNAVSRDPLRTPDEAADFLRLSTSTLAKMRVAGTGPAWVDVSPQRRAYRQSALEAYADARVRTSTSQIAA